MAPSPDDTTKPDPSVSASTSIDGYAPALWLPYAGPFVLFLVLTAVEGQLPPRFYPIAYSVKLILVSVAFMTCSRSWWGEVRGSLSDIALGVIAGLIGLPLWLGVDAITPHIALLGTRIAYNPFVAFPDVLSRTVFLSARLFGLAVLVPIIEEVFWRSFLLRFVSDPERWKSLPLGRFSGMAFGVGCVLFGLGHPEYLAGIVFAALMSGLLYKTKSLLACIVAHGVTNLALGIYVLTTGNWKYW